MLKPRKEKRVLRVLLKVQLLYSSVRTHVNGRTVTVWRHATDTRPTFSACFFEEAAYHAEHYDASRVFRDALENRTPSVTVTYAVLLDVFALVDQALAEVEEELNKLRQGGA